MIFGEKTEEQKRVAELTREVKELRKELLASKLDKKQVEVQMKDLKDALELGGNLRQGYVDSQEHMAVARRGLINMMEDMNEIPIEDVKRDLDRLNGHLDQIFHECSIREDDPDFKSTADGLKNMAANMDKINLIMLRSELENLQALLEDTSEWRSPNFFALAYYLPIADADPAPQQPQETTTKAETTTTQATQAKKDTGKKSPATGSTGIAAASLTAAGAAAFVILFARKKHEA